MPRGILFIDDNAADCDLLGLALEELGATTEFASQTDPAQAVAMLERQRDDELPAMILLDLNMPRMNGKEVLRWIRAQPRLAQVPVVVFTTSNRSADADECRRLGADDYVVKPASFDDLLALARSFLDRLGAAS